MNLQAGSRVRHHSAGEGRVIRQRFNGFQTLVELKVGIQIWYNTRDLVLIDAVPKTNETASQANNHKPMQTPKLSTLSSEQLEERYKARRIIEALRLGITPYDHVRDFTFGRDVEMNTLTQWLNDDKPSGGTMLIEGSYGVGKTHLLDHISVHAQDLGYATARVQMDPQETPFNEPRLVYANIVQDLTYYYKEETRHGLRSFLTDAFDAGYKASDHEYFRHVYNSLNSWYEDKVWEWIEAKGPTRPNGFSQNFSVMYSQILAYNLYTYLLSSLSWIAHEYLGLSGLLILFDEAESFSLANTQIRASRAKQFVEALIRTSQNDHIMLETGKKVYNNYRLEVHSHTCNLPFAYANPAHLKLVFAFTDLSDIRYIVNRVGNVPNLFLNPIDNKNYYIAYDKIRYLYGLAYDMNAEDADDSFIQTNKIRESTRTFIKACVETLDERSHAV